MTVLTTFLKFLLNFLSDNLKKHSQGEFKHFELPETQLKRQSRTKSTVKLTWSEKMTILSTFLESSLNFLSNNLKKHYKIW